MTARTKKLNTKLRSLAKRYDGVPGLHAIRLDTGEEVGIHADRDFPTASMVKIAILVEVLRQVGEGALSWKRRFVYEDPRGARGSGVLQYLDGGLRPTLKDWATLMMCVSDNRATNFLLDLAGKANIHRMLKRHGIAPMLIHGRIFRKNARPKGTRHFGQATPRAFTLLLSKLVRGELLKEKQTQEALRIMRIQQWIHRIREHLPVNPYAPPRASSEEDGLWVASKSGSLKGFKGETGVIHLPGGAHIVLAVMGEKSKDDRPTVYNKGSVFISDCAEAIWKAWRD